MVRVGRVSKYHHAHAFHVVFHRSLPQHVHDYLPCAMRVVCIIYGQAAEHEARLLACALPALRLLRHCLGRLSDAGAKPPVGPLDAVGALLDFEVRRVWF